LIGAWFKRDRVATTDPGDAMAAALAGAMGASALVVRADDTVGIIADSLSLFGDPPPAILEDVATCLGGAPDARGGLDLMLSRARSVTEEPRAEADTEPVILLTRGATRRRLALTGRALDPDAGTTLLCFRDVTQEVGATEALEARLALMNRAVDRAPFGLAVLDAQGVVQDVNTAFRTFVGRDISAGRAFVSLFATEDAAGVERLLTGTLAASTDAPPNAPLDARLADRSDRVITVYANRTVPTEGGVPGILIHVIDATDRKRLEEQFAQSQKMQAVGQLAGGIAHDFNNVLTAIIGFCDLLLQRHQPGDPSFADVMQIQQNAQRAAGLTRQLLAFSRQQSIRSQSLDVTDTLAELSNLLRRLLGERVDLAMIHGRDLWQARGDRGQIEQIVINLAVNARDAMPKGGRLIIQTDNFVAEQAYQMREDVMPAGDYVMISVTDTGEGMSPEILARIFEPFFTTKEVGKGTGLGLAMVYGSIRQMGGFVVVNSGGAGKGTSFSLYLPKATEADRAASTGDALDGDRVPADDTGGEHILLVEDEDAVRLFSARALRAKGYEVTEARTGEIALELLADGTFDLLVTDMVMPKVDGATLIREARKKMPDLPVICISGYTRESVAKEVAELPKVGFLSKPFSLKQLAGRVRSALESSAR
jgi:two-component system cell cycle sensor histidine kinase/response regulator CckA